MTSTIAKYLPNSTSELTPAMLLKLAGASVVGACIVYCGKVWYSYGFFEKQNIPTPPYAFFWGNYPELSKNMNYSDIIRKWTSEYGKTYGYYEGHLPILVTSDLEIIKQVFVKQSSNFAARRRAPLVQKDGHPETGLLIATSSRWKMMRNIMNPTFSNSKMRELSPLLEQCADRLVSVLDKSVGTELNISEYLKRFTMDSIWVCAFGVDQDIQNNPDNIYFQKCEKIFSNSRHVSFADHLGIYFYEVKHLLHDVFSTSSKLFGRFFKSDQFEPRLWLMKQLNDLVEARLHNSSKRNDYIQLLLNAYHKDNEQTTDPSKEQSVKSLDLNEVKSNLVLFMLAGYETTSTALSYCLYVLAKYPEEQPKLLEEIERSFGEGAEKEPNTDNVHELEYMELFIKEVLRMYPIATPVVTRRCTNATTVENIKCPVDFVVAVDVLSLHYDQEIWGPVDVKEFYPMRFSPEIKRNPLAYFPFGQGPRNCIGMKFANNELKVALVKILKKFEVCKTDKTPNNLEFMDGNAVRCVRKPIFISFKRR